MHAKSNDGELLEMRHEGNMAVSKRKRGGSRTGVVENAAAFDGHIHARARIVVIPITAWGYIIVYFDPDAKAEPVDIGVLDVDGEIMLEL